MGLSRIAALLLALSLLAPACVDYALHDPCSSDSDCSGDQFCFDGLCRDPFPCQEHEDCPEGRMCIEGNCLEPQCLQDNDCPDDRICIDFQCSRCTCLSDEDCPEGYTCQDGCTCTEVTLPPCATDDDCPPWEECRDGLCQPRLACESDDDCPSGSVCENSLCVDACQSDEDCGALAVCRDQHCLQQCFGDQTCFTPGTICEDGVCVEAQCTEDEDCPGEFVRCLSGRCEEFNPCEQDSDCGDPNWICLDGICEELPGCTVDQNCAPDEVCLDNHCHPAQGCQSADDCPEQFDCIGGVCLPHACRGPADCPPDHVCSGGECIPNGDPARVYRVVILTPGGPIHQGQSLQLTAIALTQSGGQVPGIAFDWSSSESDRAAISGTGMLTGGDQAGQTLVVATAQGTSRDSDPVTFTNVLAPDSDSLRVQVVAFSDRRPVAGATVVLVSSAGQESMVSDSQGLALFSLPDGPRDIHVFSEGKDYLSVISTAAHDLLIPLKDRSSGDKAGGFTGSMEIPDGQGMVTVGIAGLSVPGDLVDLNFFGLFGSSFNTTIDLGTGSPFNLPLPARAVMGIDFEGIPITLKPDYYVTGKQGLRTAWAFGGRLNMDILGDLFSGGGATSMADILTGLSPYISIFHHGLQPAFDVRSLPLVEDVDDVDNDGDSAEMRPDWDNFMDVDLAVDQAQDLSLQVVIPELPSYQGSALNTAMVISGGLGELGFTPLGLSANNAENGIIAPLTMKMAPAHGGLEVSDYAVLVLAFPQVTGLLGQSDVAAVVHTSQTLPTDVSFESGFLDFPEDAHFHRASRTLIASGVTQATLFRCAIQSSQGNWTVYLPQADTLTFTLPDPPQGMPDLSAESQVTLGPLGLDSQITYDDLLTFNGNDLDRLNILTRAFSRYALQ